MLARTPARVIAVLAAAIAPLAVLAPSDGASKYGPDRPYTKVLKGQFKLTPLKNAAMISKSRYGYIYKAGQQDSHLVVTLTSTGKLRFRDTGTRRLKSVPAACHRASAGRGIGAVCKVPSGTSVRNPMLLEVWPRLGNDYVRTSALPAKFQSAVLVDAGRDVVRLGAGKDFVNGAKDRDRVFGGGGADWIRSGPGNDHISGGAGNDRVVGAENADAVYGGSGNDSVEGGPGNDAVYTGSGRNRALCGSGHDHATISGGDSTNSCERVRHY